MATINASRPPYSAAFIPRQTPLFGRQVAVMPSVSTHFGKEADVRKFVKNPNPALLLVVSQEPAGDRLNLFA